MSQQNRWLCVAEKPSVAKELTVILSGAHPNPIRTNSQYNSKYEFPYDLDGRRLQLVITRQAPTPSRIFAIYQNAADTFCVAPPTA